MLPDEAAAALLAAEVRGPVGIAPLPSVAPQHAIALRDGRVVDGRYTHQTCYLDGDEGELCEYHGTLCFDGEGPVVVTPDAPDGDADSGRLAELSDPHSDCVDVRHYEPSTPRYSQCSYSGDGAGDRAWLYSGSRAPQPPTDHPLELSTRQWGPGMRAGLRFREVRPEAVFPDPARGWEGVTSSGADSPLPGLPVSGSARLDRSLRPDVTFTPDALWIIPTPPGARYNPFMWMATVSSLFAAQRANATPAFGAHPNDGYVHQPPGGRHTLGTQPGIRPLEASPNTARWVGGRQWGPLPPQRTALFVGGGANQIGSASELRPWMAETLRLSAQPGLRSYFSDAGAAFNRSQLLCSRSGGVPSLRPRVFASHADAWMWRQYAYDGLGLPARGLRPHAPHPPRSILLLDRTPATGRGIANLDDVLRVLRATGLPVNYVRALGDLPPQEQAAAFASAGLIVASHGAGLGNLVFAPSHAHVIELFPPLMTSGVYRRLAGVMGLSYAALHTREVLGPEQWPSFDAGAAFSTPDFVEACVDTDISSTDAFVAPACNAASKRHPLVVPSSVLGRLVDDAIDAIGAFSATNKEWREQMQVEAGGRDAPASAAEGAPARRHPRAGHDPEVTWGDALRASVQRHIEDVKAGVR